MFCQFFVAIEEEHKRSCLIDILDKVPPTQVVVFFNTRSSLDFVSSYLTEQGTPHAVIHAELDERERLLIMNEFSRTDQSGLLLAMDILTSAENVFAASIHFDLPTSAETYLRRVGRSTPVYSRGISICFVTPSDRRGVRDIEQHFGTRIEELPDGFSFVDSRHPHS
eukprot:TRINITY_DN24221_c0_g1_i1.p1 TRINITY_DN24221_c0_g1~~TRINITY_DN24221_c0_g1_i1.p1  ORF type:complete len:167 (+),score=13.55 TRINITY_DN24221_c0_g1_i1:125-625(+)